MKKAFGCLMVIVFLILAYVFFVLWRRASPLGVGTGSIGRRLGAISDSHDWSTPSTSKGTHNTSASVHSSGGRSALSQIAANPQKWKGRRVTVSGRVRGNTHYASNRNLYRLTDGSSSLLVVDDKTPPKEYALRSVQGIVKVVKPPLGEGYAYIVSAKGEPKLELDWKDAEHFFTDKFNAIKKDVRVTTKN
jgi:hypothetical protein